MDFLAVIWMNNHAKIFFDIKKSYMLLKTHDAEKENIVCIVNFKIMTHHK